MLKSRLHLLVFFASIYPPSQTRDSLILVCFVVLVAEAMEGPLVEVSVDVAPVVTPVAANTAAAAADRPLTNKRVARGMAGVAWNRVLVGVPGGSVAVRDVLAMIGDAKPGLVVIVVFEDSVFCALIV